MTSKPFKTIDQQLDILEGRGLIIDDRESAGNYLLRNNYYSLVNGYKEFFLDKDRCNETVEVFREGTRFVHLTTLYSFDMILRFSLMHHLTSAEKALKTATVHAFCSKNRGMEDYLDPACYCSKSQYRGKHYTKNLIRLLSILQNTRDEVGEKRPYIEHYRNDYGHVPLWVLANALTFGNMSHFYDLQKIAVQNEACRLICKTTGEDTLSARRLREIYSTLTHFRNICAHGGRLFCARAGVRGDRRFANMLDDLMMVSAPYERGTVADLVDKSLSALGSVPGLREMAEKEMGLDKTPIGEIPADGSSEPDAQQQTDRTN